MGGRAVRIWPPGIRRSWLSAVFIPVDTENITSVFASSWECDGQEKAFYEQQCPTIRISAPHGVWDGISSFHFPYFNLTVSFIRGILIPTRGILSKNTLEGSCTSFIEVML